MHKVERDILKLASIFSMRKETRLSVTSKWRESKIFFKKNEMTMKVSFI